MKRDMDLVREILLTIEAEPSGHAPRPFTVEGYEEDEIEYHVFIMEEADLLTAADKRHFGSVGPRAIPLRMTWCGHEFLDASRDPARWEKAKAIANRVGGVSVSILQGVLIKLAEAQISGLMQ